MHEQTDRVEELPSNDACAAPQTTTALEDASGSQRLHGLILVLILLLGFGLRLSACKWGQAYSYFGQGDAVEAYQVAVNYGHGEPRPQYLGQPNYNLHSKLPGQLWTIFCFVSCRFWGSVQGIAFTIVLLNTAAIYLVYVLARQSLGEKVALLAALLMATSPWAVYYSAGVYNPNVMSFLGALLFLVLWRCLQTEGTSLICWAPILLLMLPQFHMSGLQLIPAVAVVLALGARRVNIRWLALGITAGLCLYLPYVRGDMAHDWQNTRAMFAANGKGYSLESFKAITAPLNFLVNWGPRWVRSMGDYHELGRACFGSFGILLVVNVVSGVAAGFLIVGTVLEVKAQLAGFWRAPRLAFRNAPGVSFLVIPLAVALLLATVAGKPFHSRYCIVLLPLLFPLVALGAMHWLARADRMRHVFGAALVVTSCANVWLILSMYYHQGRHIEDSQVLIPSFRQLDNIYQQVKAHAGTNSWVQVDSSNYLSSLRPEQKQEKDAVLVTKYVAIREKDQPGAAEARQKRVYELRAADSVPEGSTVAYEGHGIAVIEVKGD